MGVPEFDTFPPPAGVFQLPSPRRKLLDEGVPVALIPATGSAVPLVRLMAEGVPAFPPAKNNAPVPVSSVTAARRLALVGVPSHVAIPVPNPESVAREIEVAGKV